MCNRYTNSILTICSILFTLFVLEAVVCQFADRTPEIAGNDNVVALPYVMLFHKPNSTFEASYGKSRADKGKKSTVTTDAFGFRDGRVLRREKAAGEFRIFLVGGSAVLNGVTNTTTISHHLERLIKEHCKIAAPIVINAGMTMANSDQELALLVYRILDLEPNLIIVYDGFNDLNNAICMNLPVGYPAIWPHFMDAWKKDTMAASILKKMNTLELLFARSNIARVFFPQYSLDGRLRAALEKKTRDDNQENTIEHAIDHLVANWKKMLTLCWSINAKVVIFLQPINPNQYMQTVGCGVDLGRAYTAAKDAVTSLGAQGLPIVSLADLLSDHREYFYDNVHVFDEYHPVLADELFNHLLALNVLPRE